MNGGFVDGPNASGGFREEDHPRDAEGKFAPGSGESDSDQGTGGDGAGDNSGATEFSVPPERIEMLDPHISTPNNIEDQAKFDELVSSMERNGWVGRPVIVEWAGEEDYEGIQAWTASHRLLAAQEAGLDEVPTVRLLPETLKWFDDEGYDKIDGSYLHNFIDDEDRLKALKQAGDHVAAAIMAKEIEQNELSWSRNK